MSTFNPFYTSTYLALRYVPLKKINWQEKAVPVFKTDFFKKKKKRIPVSNATQIIDYLSKIKVQFAGKKVGILLSSGIDSAILANFLPKNTVAYTVDFLADGFQLKESKQAAKIANHLKIKHTIIQVGWSDYTKNSKKLTLHKKSPLHPSEIALYLAARAAIKDGIKNLFVGTGADTIFGGMDKLLSEDWTLTTLPKRYSVLNPSLILKDPADLQPIFKQYSTGNVIDIERFLTEIFGTGIHRMFEHAIDFAGCTMVSPFENLKLAEGLDIKRVKMGDSKYLLREVYKVLYPNIQPKEKIPFARPLDIWMKDWDQVERPEFRKDIHVKSLNGEQKWLLYSLQEFMNLFERK